MPHRQPAKRFQAATTGGRIRQLGSMANGILTIQANGNEREEIAMENLAAIIKAQQLGECKELALPGTQQLSRDSLVQLGTLLRQMSAAFPHQEYDGETTAIFLMTFEDLALKYGLSNLEIALRVFLTRQKFFPHPAEVAEELEAMSKKAKAEVKLPPLGCNLCHDGGWAPGYILRLCDGKREVKECECLKKRKAAKAEVA
jgi:hypothetical protein